MDQARYFADHPHFAGLPELADLYARLDDRIRQGRGDLACPSGCARCCTVPPAEIEASLFEFLPLALWAWDNGVAEEILARIQAGPGRCVLYREPGPAGRGCAAYPFRPLMCRLFGNSLVESPRSGASLYACRLLKDSPAGQKVLRSLAETAADPGSRLPEAAAWRRQLDGIHPRHAQPLLGLNAALAGALRAVGLYRRLVGAAGNHDGRARDPEPAGQGTPA